MAKEKSSNLVVGIVLALAGGGGGLWWWRKHHPKVGDMIVANLASAGGATVQTNMVVTAVNADGSVVAYVQGQPPATAVQVPKASIVRVAW